MNGPRYGLELLALDDDVPAIIRLRAALKRLGRVYKLKCTAAEQLPVEPLAASAAGASCSPDRGGHGGRHKGHTTAAGVGERLGAGVPRGAGAGRVHRPGGEPGPSK